MNTDNKQNNQIKQKIESPDDSYKGRNRDVFLQTRHLLHDIGQIIGVLSGLCAVLLFIFIFYGFNYNNPINIKPFILIIFGGALLFFILSFAEDFIIPKIKEIRDNNYSSRSKAQSQMIRQPSYITDRWDTEELGKTIWIIFCIGFLVYIIFFRYRY